MTDKPNIPSPDQLKEGVHYYLEGPFMVFTEAYHLLRGYCCGNKCRHCPYSADKKDKGKSYY